jgi:ribosomal protein L7/L12
MNAPSLMELVYLLVLLVAVAIVFVEWRLSDVLKRVSAVSRLDAKLDLLLMHAGIEFDPYKHLPPEVMDAVQRGKKIEAIKRYRESTGAGLKEAKDFIEEVQRRAGVRP